MLTLAEAEAVAIDYMRKEMPEYPGEFVVFPEATVAKSYGWIFNVNCRRYAETGDFLDMLVGLGPIVVRHNRRVYVLSSGIPPEESVAALEKKLGLRP